MPVCPTVSPHEGASVVALWGEGLCVVWGWIVDSGGLQGFFALDARAAFATVVCAAFVAAPCFGIVEAEPFANARDVGFGNVGIGRHNMRFYVGSGCGCGVDGADELRRAVGIEGVVAAMVGDENLREAVTFGHANGNGEHDAVAEGHHGGLHVVGGIMAFGNGVGTLEQRAFEVALHEV